MVKESGPIASDFLHTVEILVPEESSYFLITFGEFRGWKMYRLEDIYENMSSYGNHY